MCLLGRENECLLEKYFQKTLMRMVLWLMVALLTSIETVVYPKKHSGMRDIPVRSVFKIRQKLRATPCQDGHNQVNQQLQKIDLELQVRTYVSYV
jgi:hypothetical protein